MQHRDAASGRWFEFSLVEQLANVGSEVIRAINWRKKNNADYSRLAFERALELLDITCIDEKNISRLHEVTRVREALVDYFFGENTYQSSDKLWENYFMSFTYAARVGRL